MTDSMIIGPLRFTGRVMARVTRVRAGADPY